MEIDDLFTVLSGHWIFPRILGFLPICALQVIKTELVVAHGVCHFVSSQALKSLVEILLEIPKRDWSAG